MCICTIPCTSSVICRLILTLKGIESYGCLQSCKSEKGCCQRFIILCPFRVSVISGLFPFYDLFVVLNKALDPLYKKMCVCTHTKISHNFSGLRRLTNYLVSPGLQGFLGHRMCSSNTRTVLGKLQRLATIDSYPPQKPFLNPLHAQESFLKVLTYQKSLK